MENKRICPPPKIEYRYIPRTFYEEQVNSINLKNLYSGLFDKPDTWSTYPFNENISTYNRNNFNNFIDKSNT